MSRRCVKPNIMGSVLLLGYGARLPSGCAMSCCKRLPPSVSSAAMRAGEDFAGLTPSALSVPHDLAKLEQQIANQIALAYTAPRLETGASAADIHSLSRSWRHPPEAPP
jgi:hypothetical protein